MEYYKPPEFAEASTDSETAAEAMQSFSDSDDTSDQPEAYVANILEDKSKKTKRRVDYSQFNSAEFNEVDTLLTNVEDYSKRIRKDVDKYAKKVRNETDLFRSEIELELANALIKRIEAEKKAEEIIQNAEDTRDEVRKQGHDEGFQAGFEEGIKQHKVENEKNTSAVLSLLNELKNLRKQVTQKFENQIVHLSLLMAQKVVHKQLKTDKKLVLGLLKKSMQHFEGKGNIRIKVHPVEYKFILENQEELNQFLDENQVVSVRADEAISPASPIIESDFSYMDLSLKKQFSELEERLNLCVDDRKTLFT
jgi:flagellar assembly protein FliH